MANSETFFEQKIIKKEEKAKIFKKRDLNRLSNLHNKQHQVFSKYDIVLILRAGQQYAGQQVPIMPPSSGQYRSGHIEVDSLFGGQVSQFVIFIQRRVNKVKAIDNIEVGS